MTNDNLETLGNNHTTSYSKFAERLTFAMLVRNYSNLKLSEEIYVSPSTISSYRSGHRQPNFEVLRSISLALNVSTDFLLGLSDYIDVPAGYRYTFIPPQK